MIWKKRPTYGASRSPFWLHLLQAGAIGIVAGLVLSALLSVAVLQGSGMGAGETPASECRRARPARDAATPPAAPAVGRARGRAEHVRLS
jgi:hypothetical protein